MSGASGRLCYIMAKVRADLCVNSASKNATSQVAFFTQTAV